MNYRFASDCHTHSDCSPDGRSPAEEMLRRAGELGLYAFTLTDHCECQKFETRYRERSALALETMKRIAPTAPAGLKFYFGVELGQPTQNLPAAEKIAADPAYDFVIGSLHNLRGGLDFYDIGQRAGEKGLPKERQRELFQRYFEELEEIAAWGKFDSLAHITYPLRYLFPAGSSPSFDGHQEALEAVLLRLIRSDKALEMNTSRLWRDDAPRLPDLEVFQFYKALGGKLVTLGSDAHSAENLGRGIEAGMELLKAAGFTEFAVYEKREPVLLPLE